MDIVSLCVFAHMFLLCITYFISLVLKLIRSSAFKNQLRSSAFKNQLICHFLFDFSLLPKLLDDLRIFCVYIFYNAHCFCFHAASSTDYKLLWGLNLRLCSLTEYFRYNKSLIEVYWINKCVIPWWVPNNIFMKIEFRLL